MYILKKCFLYQLYLGSLSPVNWLPYNLLLDRNNRPLLKNAENLHMLGKLILISVGLKRVIWGWPCPFKLIQSRDMEPSIPTDDDSVKSVELMLQYYT